MSAKSGASSTFILLLTLLVTVVAGCGGGGGGSVITTGGGATAAAPLSLAAGTTAATVGTANDMDTATAGIQTDVQIAGLPPSSPVQLLGPPGAGRGFASGMTMMGQTMTNAIGMAMFTRVTFTESGTYQVVDANGNVLATFEITVHMSAQNRNPTASAGDDKTGFAGSPVVLSGSGTDLDGDTLTYQWTQTSGATVTLTGAATAQATFTPGAAGLYVFSLAVSDGRGGSAMDSVTVNVSVQSTNHAPTASAGSDQTVELSTQVTLSGSGLDQDSDTLTYSWAQTSGTNVTLIGVSTPNPTFTPTAAGSYVFTLTVSDGRGGSASDSVTVTVSSVNNAPSAKAGSDQDGVGFQSTVLLNASASSDPDAGDTLKYKWTASSSNKVKVTLQNATSAQASFVTTDLLGLLEPYKVRARNEYGVQGLPDNHQLYTFTVTVEDPDGLTSTATTHVDPASRVSNATNVPKGATIYLNGGEQDTYSWTIVSKPQGSNATLVGADTRFPLLVPDLVGFYEVKEGSRDPLKIHAGEYVGVSNCKLCHTNKIGNASPTYNDWAQTWHAKKFERALNGENGAYYSEACIRCHVTGYDTLASASNGGFDDVAHSEGWTFPTTKAPGTYDAQPAAIKALANIQCEACHGPGGQHMGDKEKIARSMAADVCAVCHSTQPGEWNQAAHSNGTTSPATRGGSNSCGGCHSGVGYLKAASWAESIASTDTAIPLPGSWSSVIASNETTIAAITCASCHDPHKTRTPGSRDPSDHQLRIWDRDMQLLDGTIVTNTGHAATCMMCHHGRTTGPVDGEKSTSRFYPHYSNQTDMYAGAGGWEFTGETYNNSFHTDGVEDKCITCHMATGPKARTVDTMGEHTFAMRDKDGNPNAVQACGSCHTGLTSFDRPAWNDFDGDGTKEGVQTEIHGLLELVAHTLESKNPKGWFRYETNSSHSGDFTVEERHSVWNYGFVEHDGSAGVHNTQYAAKLLQDSYKDLTGQAVTAAYSNNAPTFATVPDQTVAVNTEVTLTVSATDLDTDTLNYFWGQTSGTAVTLTDAATSTAKFTPAAAGTYVFRITVGDGKGGVQRQEVTITVN